MWPNALEDWHSHKTGLSGIIHKILHGRKRWEGYEEIALRLFDKAIVVTEEMKDRLENKYAIPSQKISIVKNTEFQNDQIIKFRTKNVKNLSLDKISFGYIGGIGEHRGLHQIVEAFKSDEFLRRECEIKIFGDGDLQYMRKLKTIIDSNELKKTFDFLVMCH